MKASCVPVKLKESMLYHQHMEKKKIFHNRHTLMEKKLLKANLQNFKESFKWYCQVCGLMLSSKLQAQEHFFGKRHQNVLKSKDFYNQNCCTRLKLEGQSVADKKNLEFDRLLHPSESLNQNFRSDYEICASDDIIPPPAGRDNILETVIKSEKKTFYSSDLSIYRTPSGKYYCQPCNITVNSQAQFLQHLESRKHKQKANKASLRVK